MKKFVSYVRVSTNKQGLGLEAQTATIQSYVSAHDGSIIASFSEKESGKETINRPALQEAIMTAKTENAVLIVAKLDRLSRDIMDIFSLKKMKGLTFDVCDIDASDTMTLGIFATLAQKEREMISKRTREALAAKKADGIQLGNPNLVAHNAAGMAQARKAGRASADARKAQADTNEANRKAWAVINGRTGSLSELATILNDAGFRTSTGGTWNKVQVSRLIKRYGN